MTETPDQFADDAGRYRLEARIATGGMGEVWRAQDTVLGREVAIKLLKPEFADDPVFRARFEAEARHAAVLQHPGVAALFDVGEQLTPSGDPRPYLVMELVDGRPLSSLIRPGTGMDPEVVRDLIAQTGEALAAAHAAGIVHRDVKPANLLVTSGRVVKVTDFGIARAVSGAAVTGTGTVMGTPQYLSPEQARGETATPASDVYGLGVVAYECLAGRRPFEKETAVATALAHLNDPVPPLPATVPADLAAVVMRALAKKPADRFPDAGALAAALRGTRGMGDLPTEVVPSVGEPAHTQVLAPVAAGVAAGAAAGAGAAGAAGAPAPGSPRDEGDGDDGRISPWVIALLVGLVLALILVAWLLLRGGADEAPTPEPRPTTSSAPATRTPSRPATSAVPETVVVDESDYVGRDVDRVVAELRGLGLRPSTQRVDNPGDEEADTVVALSPTGEVEKGAAIEVAYYGPQPPSETPTPTPTSSAPPSTPATPTPTPTPTSSPAASTPATAETSSPTASTSQPPAAREDMPR